MSTTPDAAPTAAHPHRTTPGGVPDGHVLVVGEALIDVVHRADGSIDEHPGGSLANVALTLGRLGRDARLVTWIGDDAHGAVLRSWLDESHVTLTEGSADAPSTSVATAHLDDQGAATYEFDLEWQVPPGTDVAPSTLAVHTGSIAAVLEPGATAVRALVAAARDSATITYDPNARPALMGEPADTRVRIEELVALSDVVKVSDEDLEWLVPDADPLAVARRWRSLGPALVVVTLGGEGAVALTAAGELHVAAPRVTVVDTVGAGDSFMGALVDGLWDADLLGAGRREALRAIDAHTLTGLLERCAAVAAVTVSRAGANPPRRAELAPTTGAV
ncbi:carbohydrate kinase family protein [Cellulosimicrobium arenosum]|uniref:Carbohydrate kinase n=1 Tax=Cellulosimicrobium arenosum TaxID=2708133 RepID=A0A927G785_9MICO|nr:carbohydrate kinase [Cellulosimicrobium arenosum]MBD8078148.1 carbohydrate kinase [Cellulosimicrobium arenosum]